MIVKLLTEHHLEFLSVKGGCRGSSESTLVKMSNCWKSHAAAHICNFFLHRKTVVAGIDTQRQAYLADLLKLSNSNDKHTYLLCIVHRRCLF